MGPFLVRDFAEMDGFEATERIRSMASGREIPIIAITANALTGDRERCLAVGMNDYMNKPLQLTQLLEMIHRWLPGPVSDKTR